MPIENNEFLGYGRGCPVTFLWHVRPLRVGELVLAHTDTPLHPGRDGQPMIGVKWGVTTEPVEGGEEKVTHIHIHTKLMRDNIHVSPTHNYCFIDITNIIHNKYTKHSLKEKKTNSKLLLQHCMRHKETWDHRDHHHLLPPSGSLRVETLVCLSASRTD